MSRSLMLGAGVLLVLLAAGCAPKLEPKWGPGPQTPPKISKKPDQGIAPGSLWSDRQNLCVDNKASQVGDIVTVAIYEQASASKEASTKSDRSSSISAGIPNLFGLEGSSAVVNNDPLDLSNLIQGDFGDKFSGSGKTSRQANLSATIATQVVDILPNGNLRIFGRKRVVVNNEEQFIGLSGLVRPEDIDARNMVDSKYVVDAEITYTGQGALSDKQRPGWLMRLIDNAWPF